MTIRYENNQLVNLMSHKIIKTHLRTKDDTWRICCSTCKHKFDDGEDRHEWRMFLPAIDFAKYRNGSFMTTHCHECFAKTMLIWQRTITEEIEAMPQHMRELAQ